MIELYQIEHCPYCKKVRNRLDELGVSYVSHSRNNPETEKRLIGLGGKRQVPMLVDPNHDLMLYESDDIVAHLDKHYSN